MRVSPAQRLLALCCIVLPFGTAATVPAKGTIVILGSSTAQGVGASAYANSWAGLLTSALTPKGYVIQNVSISGTNTSDSLARFDTDVTPYSPRFVMLATSIVNEPAAAPAESYLQNSVLLIQKVESIGAIPILVAPYPNNGFSADLYASIKAIYVTLGAQGVPLLDFLDGTDDGQGHWLPGLSLDGTHPTDTGHSLLFDCIPLTLFDALQLPLPPVNPHGFGSWMQTTDPLTPGDMEILPSSAMGSWSISFWTEPSAATTERVVLSVNAGALQVRRTGSVWKLWQGSTSLAITEVRGAPTFHHVAITYQSFSGILNWYVDSELRSTSTFPGFAPITLASLGGDAVVAALNATGDSFADLILYRAPLAQSDIEAIFAKQAPWKSIEAWLPLDYSPSRAVQNLAASVPTVAVRGSWIWTGAATPPGGTGGTAPLTATRNSTRLDR